MQRDTLFGKHNFINSSVTDRMYKILLIICFVLVSINSSCQSIDYNLIWHDEFDGNKLNEANWCVEVNGSGNGNEELQFYKKENITVGKEPISGKNCLIITAKKEEYQNKKATSGRLNTKGNMTVKYGKIEASIKLPKIANGLWPAFWLLGADYSTVGWPKCGEIDIMEMGNSEGQKKNTQEKLFNGACHWGYYENNWYPNFAQSTTNKYSLQDDQFHLYTLIWTENDINMYLDLDKHPKTKPYFSMKINDFSDPKSPGHYFNKEFFVILNLAVGGYYTGILDINQITALDQGEAKMYVDYVRVYKK